MKSPNIVLWGCSPMPTVVGDLNVHVATVIQISLSWSCTINRAIIQPTQQIPKQKKIKIVCSKKTVEETSNSVQTSFCLFWFLWIWHHTIVFWKQLKLSKQRFESQFQQHDQINGKYFSKNSREKILWRDIDRHGRELLIFKTKQPVKFGKLKLIAETLNDSSDVKNEAIF